MTLSGSSNSHSRLAPSASKRWMSCTASPKFLEENRDQIIKEIKIAEVIKLTPYLLEIPKEEVFDHEWRAMRHVKNYLSDVDYFREKEDPDPAGRAFAKLTEEQKKDIEDSSGSIAAREGTRAHEFAAAIQLGRKKIEDIPEEFRVPVQIYIDHCKAVTPPGAEVFIEAKAQLFYSDIPGDTGTSDYCAISPNRIVVCDLKYGKGVLVHAEDNEQLAIYGYSFIKENDALYGFDPATIVELHIVQPRHHEAEEVKLWVMTLADLRIFCEPIDMTAKGVRSGELCTFNPGSEPCMWCVKPLCDAHRNWATGEFAIGDFDSGVDLLSGLPDLSKDEQKLPVEERIALCLDGFSDSEILRMWTSRKRVASLLDDIHEYINDRALAGDDFGGAVKLVAGRQSDTAWVDKTAAETFMKGQGLKLEDRNKMELISPTQAKKLLADKLKSTPRTQTRFDQLVTRSPGRPTAALSDDKRDAVPSAVDALPDLTDTEL